MTLENFHCRCCGACCRIKDGFVRVSEAEVARIAAFLGMSESDFIERETEIAPDRKSLMLKSLLDGSCAYLTADNLCHINPVKPGKCRTFPFEWVNPDSATVCPELTRYARYVKAKEARAAGYTFSVVCSYDVQDRIFRALIDGADVEDAADGTILVKDKKFYPDDDRGAAWHDVWITPDGEIVRKGKITLRGSDL